jgi:hypothetical protein
MRRALVIIGYIAVASYAWWITPQALRILTGGLWP